MDRTRINPRWLNLRRPARALAPLVAFVVVAVFAAAGCGSSGPDVSARSTPGQADSSPAPDDANASATQSVRYRNVEFTVPAGWPVYDLEADPSICVRFDVNAVYLGHPGADMQCPATVNGHAASVLVEPLEGAANLSKADVQVNGVNGLAVEVDPAAGTEHQLRAALPTVGLAVTVTFEDSDADAQQILQSFHAATP
jgi:hypothetical protein